MKIGSFFDEMAYSFSQICKYPLFKMEEIQNLVPDSTFLEESVYAKFMNISTIVWELQRLYRLFIKRFRSQCWIIFNNLRL